MRFTGREVYPERRKESKGAQVGPLMTSPALKNVGLFLFITLSLIGFLRGYLHKSQLILFIINRKKRDTLR